MALTKAIEQLKAELKSKTSEAEKINKAIKLLENGSSTVTPYPFKKKRKMSPEAIEKIRAAAKKRWADIKKKTPTKKP